MVGNLSRINYWETNIILLFRLQSMYSKGIRRPHQSWISALYVDWRAFEEATGRASRHGIIALCNAGVSRRTTTLEQESNAWPNTGCKTKRYGWCKEILFRLTDKNFKSFFFVEPLRATGASGTDWSLQTILHRSICIRAREALASIWRFIQNIWWCLIQWAKSQRTNSVRVAERRIET